MGWVQHAWLCAAAVCMGGKYLVHALRRDARVRHATKPFIQHSLSVAIGDTLEGLDSSVVMPLHNRRDSPPRRF